MVKFKLDENVKAPEYKTEGAAGMDVTAQKIIAAYKGDEATENDKLENMQKGFLERGYIKLRAFERILFGTGITVADMSPNLEIQVRSRSGLSLKKGIVVINQPGTIDSDYRGEIGVILYNSSPFLVQVDKNERIAQLVVNQIRITKPEIVSDIELTDRGKDGFGSTGTKEQDLI